MEHIHKERLGAVLRKCEVRALSALDEGSADQARIRPQGVRRVREFAICLRSVLGATGIKCFTEAEVV